MQLIKDLKNKALSKSKSLLQRRDTGAVILLYHRVVDLRSDPQLLSVSCQNFEKQIKRIKKNYKVLNFDELNDLLENKKNIPAKSVLLSFDDGYYDNEHFARDILERYQLPAIVFVSTANLNTTKEYWWDALERCILNNSHFPLRLDLDINHWQLGKYLLRNVKDSFEVYTKLIEDLRSLYPDQRNEIIDHIAVISNNIDGRNTHRAMSNEELISLSNSRYITIGAHTHNHPSLAKLDCQTQRFEIQESKKRLESLIGKDVRYFSYPFGTINDYSTYTKEICMEQKFSLVASNFPGIVLPAVDKFELPRHLVRDWDDNEFSSRLRSFFK